MKNLVVEPGLANAVETSWLVLWDQTQFDVEPESWGGGVVVPTWILR